MKTKITSICLAIMLLMTAFNAKAGIYYVTEGQEFKLVPGILQGLTITSHLWKLDGTDVPNGDLEDGKTFKKILPVLNNAVTKHTISLSVETSLNGCLSDLVTHTVYVLPKIVVTATTTVDNFCTNLANISAVITTSLDRTVAGFGDSGITLSGYKWYRVENGVPTLIENATASSYTATQPGTYRAALEYILPTDDLLKPTATKIVDIITPGNQTIQQTLTLPSTPSIQLL